MKARHRSQEQGPSRDYASRAAICGEQLKGSWNKNMFPSASDTRTSAGRSFPSILRFPLSVCCLSFSFLSKMTPNILGLDCGRLKDDLGAPAAADIINRLSLKIVLDEQADISLLFASDVADYSFICSRSPRSFLELLVPFWGVLAHGNQDHQRFFP